MPVAPKAKVNAYKITQLFNSYKSEQDLMEDDGIERFCSDLGVNAETDLIVLMVAKYMEAKQMGEFTFEEFKRGSETLGCDTVSAWKNIIQK